MRRRGASPPSRRCLAEAIERQVTEPAPDAPPPAPEAVAMPFARVARVMRMTALLQTRLIGDLEQARGRDDPAWGHKVRVEDIVARVARPRYGDDEKALERLMTEVCERLDDNDIYGDVMTRPVGELVALICRDLGLDPDWTRLAEEAWAREEIESGVPNSPFLNLHRQRPPFIAAANGRGGSPVDVGAMPGEERVVEGAGQIHPPFDPSS